MSGLQILLALYIVIAMTLSFLHFVCYQGKPTNIKEFGNLLLGSVMVTIVIPFFLIATFVEFLLTLRYFR
jgi:hypothetical protein